MPAEIFKSYAEQIECRGMKEKERANCAKSAALYGGGYIFRPLLTPEECLKLFKTQEDSQTICGPLTAPHTILLSDDLPSRENYLRHEFLHAAYVGLTKKEIRILERGHRALKSSLEKALDEGIDSVKLMAASRRSTEFYAYLAGGLDDIITKKLKAELALADPEAHTIYEKLEARAQEWLEGWLASREDHR